MGIYFFIRKLDRKEGGQEKQGEKASQKAKFFV